mgnify:CR=1 FL=1
MKGRKKVCLSFILFIVMALLISCVKNPVVIENEIGFESPEQNQEFPSRAIQIVIPFAPGGGTDSVARALIVSANNYFDQPVVAVNKLGESGARGLREGLLAAPDGYTVTLITTETNSLSVFGLLDFNYTDIEPLLLLNTEPGVMVVSKNFPFNSIEELVESIYKENKEYTIGSAGKGSNWDLAAKGVEREADIKFESKFYNGTSLAVLDVLGGSLDIVIAGTSEVVQHLEKGEMKLLTVLADERLEAFPDVKTFKESGYDFSIYTWRGLAIPQGVDPEVKRILMEGFANAAKDKNFIDMLSQLRLNYDFREQDDFIEFLEQDLKFYNEMNNNLSDSLN